MINHRDLTWCKSSYSQGQDNCVETAWHKSTHSQGENNCVESATEAGTVYLRDSKLGHASPILAFTPAEWTSFLTSTKSDTFNS